MRLALSLILASLALGWHAGCGKEVSLGAGPVAVNDAGDGATQGDAADEIGPPPNACVAAGGRCLPLGATCNAPGDPALATACGDPAVSRCCMPLPDAGPFDLVVGGADRPADLDGAKQ